MSGTSLDAVDAVLLRGLSDQDLCIVAHAQRPWPVALADELLALCVPGEQELHRSALAARGVAQVYAQTAQDCLKQAGVLAAHVGAVGAHGQTVRHEPHQGYSLQLLDAAYLAETLQIPIVSDLRSRDVAAGGQGAPLVPAFHAACFRTHQPVAVLNLGGIANLTWLPPLGSGDPILGFDTGPGNMLLDAWVQRHLGRAFDDDGAWAASGQVLDHWVDDCLRSEPYFSWPAPKSTGRDRFGWHWLEARWPKAAAPEDLQASLLELTVRSVAHALMRAGLRPAQVWVCGGGAHNRWLIQRLHEVLGVPVQPTEIAGWPAQQVEAAAFAWLGRACIQGEAGNIPTVTGARGPRILGQITPA